MDASATAYHSSSSDDEEEEIPATPAWIFPWQWVPENIFTMVISDIRKLWNTKSRITDNAVSILSGNLKHPDLFQLADNKVSLKLLYVTALHTNLERQYEDGFVEVDMTKRLWQILDDQNTSLTTEALILVCYILGSVSVVSPWWRDNLEQQGLTLKNSLLKCLEATDLLKPEDPFLANELLLDSLAAWVRVFSTQVPLCDCSLPLYNQTCAQCYASAAVSCNVCMSHWSGTEEVWHCDNGKTAAHDAGYDLCPICAAKELAVINRLLHVRADVEAWLEKHMVYRKLSQLLNLTTTADSVKGSCITILGHKKKNSEAYTSQLSRMADSQTTSGAVAIRTLFKKWYPSVKLLSLTIQKKINLLPGTFQDETITNPDKTLCMLAEPTAIEPCAVVMKSSSVQYVSSCILFATRPNWRKAVNPVRRALFLVSNEIPTKVEVEAVVGMAQPKHKNAQVQTVNKLSSTLVPLKDASSCTTSSPLVTLCDSNTNTPTPADPSQGDSSPTSLSPVVQTVSKAVQHSPNPTVTKIVLPPLPTTPLTSLNTANQDEAVLDPVTEAAQCWDNDSEVEDAVYNPHEPEVTLRRNPGRFYYELVHTSQTKLARIRQQAIEDKTDPDILPPGIWPIGFIDLDDNGSLTTSNYTLQPTNIRLAVLELVLILEYQPPVDYIPQDLIPLIMSYIPSADRNSMLKSMPEDEGMGKFTKHLRRCYGEVAIHPPVKAPLLTCVLLDGMYTAIPKMDCYYIGASGADRFEDIPPQPIKHSAIGLGTPAPAEDENVQTLDPRMGAVACAPKILKVGT
eukprot:TRINITY_DN61163_c0_g1_i1.p1 TRINITY_DN61163_c0_g1~~TRINITY_DN61163_c0_g1_i1.p1  ORF type:complete len:826 (-),score=35.99 TRINITY_DN61163_c0_g1_i1:1292-3679(-)